MWDCAELERFKVITKVEAAVLLRNKGYIQVYPKAGCLPCRKMGSSVCDSKNTL